MWFKFLVKKGSTEFLNKQIKTIDAVTRLSVTKVVPSWLCFLLQAEVSDSYPAKQPPARHPGSLPEGSVPWPSAAP